MSGIPPKVDMSIYETRPRKRASSLRWPGAGLWPFSSQD